MLNHQPVSSLITFLIGATAIVVLLIYSIVSSHAQNFSCTPAPLVETFKAIVDSCGGSFNNAYRPGARIAGSGRVSQHSFCNGKNGAVDINTRNRSCAVKIGREKGFFVINYGWGVHVGTDGSGRRARRIKSWPVTMSE